MEASITLKKVGKLIHDKTILAGLNFGIEKGSLVAIIGDNEAGKSILLKVISSAEYQEYGQVFINGVDSKTRRSEVVSKIGYIPHELDLDPWLTLEQNIRFSGLLYSKSLETINTRMVQYARDLHIVPYLNKMVKDISPGIVRMGMIVKSLVHDPEILILDDPTAFMDAESYRYTWDLLLRLKGSKTIVYVSQSLQEVESAHDRILVLENGRIALDGSLDRLLGSTFEFWFILTLSYIYCLIFFLCFIGFFEFCFNSKPCFLKSFNYIFQILIWSNFVIKVFNTLKFAN